MSKCVDLGRYPRNPLLVRVSWHESSQGTKRYAAVFPDDPGYEKLYQARLEGAEKSGVPMGYAEKPGTDKDTDLTTEDTDRSTT